MFGNFLVHAWRTFCIGSVRVKHSLACQGVLKWVWSSMNWNRFLFNWVQMLLLSMHNKKYNSIEDQHLTKKCFKWKDNCSILTNIVWIMYSHIESKAWTYEDFDTCAGVLTMLQGETHHSEMTGEMPRAFCTFLYLFLWKYQAVCQMWWFLVWRTCRNQQYFHT